MFSIHKHANRYTSALFIRFVKRWPCCRCGTRIDVTASHMISKGRADGSDALAVPACLSCHPQSTRAARELLIGSGIDLDALRSQLWFDFLMEHGIIMQGKDGIHTKITQDEFEVLTVEAGLAKFHDGSTRKNRKKFTKSMKA